MGYDSVKAQNHKLYAKQYKFNRQNDGTTPNAIKTYKQTQNNARMGSTTSNSKNTNFQNLEFLPAKLVVGL